MTAGLSSVLNISTVEHKLQHLEAAFVDHGRRSTKEKFVLFMTWSLDVTPKTTEQILTVCTRKSEAEVTKTKNLQSRNGTVETN